MAVVAQTTYTVDVDCPTIGGALELLQELLKLGVPKDARLDLAPTVTITVTHPDTSGALTDVVEQIVSAQR